MDGMAALIPIIIVVGGIITVVMFNYFIPVGLLITALVAGVRIELVKIFEMRITKIPPSVIVNTMITAHKAGIAVTTDNLMEHFLAGGNVQNVVDALIRVNKSGIHLSWEKAAEMDLAKLLET